MTDFRNTTVNRIINVDGNFNITIQYVLIQFREYDETINAIYRLNSGNPLTRIENNKTISYDNYYVHYIFDKYVDVNNNIMPSICPNHNEIYYAKWNEISVPKEAYIEATGYGIGNQSMIQNFIINSPINIYLKDTTYLNYVIKPTVTTMGNNQYKVSFKIQNFPFNAGLTSSITKSMVLYKNSSCTDVVTSTSIIFRIINTGTPVGD